MIICCGFIGCCAKAGVLNIIKLIFRRGTKFRKATKTTTACVMSLKLFSHFIISMVSNAAFIANSTDTENSNAFDPCVVMVTHSVSHRMRTCLLSPR